MMMTARQTGGSALIVGYVLLLGVLFREPASGVAAATSDPAAVVYFIVVPVGGLLAGVYASVSGPYDGVPLFVFGSYLGVAAVGLLFGGLVSRAPLGAAVVVGGVLMPLAVTALVASLLPTLRRIAGLTLPPSGSD